MNIILSLFLTFFKIGITTFGGGYAMISQIKETIVDKKKWISNDELLEIIAISESTPGPIAINMATFIGFRKGGFFGSLLATLGVILPSFLIIYIISFFVDQFLENKYVAYAFVGIKCAVAFLILKAGFKMIKESAKSILTIVIFSLVTILMIILDLFSLSFSSIFIILIGGFISWLVYTILDSKKKEDNL